MAETKVTKDDLLKMKEFIEIMLNTNETFLTFN